MVTAYVLEAGDIVMMDFDPQLGRERAKRRPALVLTDQRYNRASGLAIICPLTSKRKPDPFALPISSTFRRNRWCRSRRSVKEQGVGGRKAKFRAKADPASVGKVRQYITVLFGLR